MNFFLSDPFLKTPNDDLKIANQCDHTNDCPSFFLFFMKFVSAGMLLGEVMW